MKNTLTRYLSLLLAVLMIALLLIACNDPQTPPTNDDKIPSDDTQKPSDGNGGDTDGGDETEQIPDYILQVPQDDFAGESVTILGRTDHEYEMFVEEDNASTLIEKGVFARNSRVEEYLGVELGYYPTPGSWGEQYDFIGVVQQSVATNDDAFQIVSAYSAYNCVITMNDQYYDLRSLDNPMLDADWWASSWVENATVNDKLFFLIGDLSLSMWEQLFAVFFNRELAEEHGDFVGNLYEKVRRGEWTLEELTILAESLYVDDGDDMRNAADTFGLATAGQKGGLVRLMITACDLPITTRTDDGLYELTLMDEEHAARTEAVYAAMYELMSNISGATWETYTDASGESGSFDIFVEGRALLYSDTLSSTDRFREAELNYGILPLPKYDEDQESYRSHSGDNASSFSIPTSCSDPEMSARVLDALAAESKRVIVPAYYEVVLKGRAAQDTDSVEMLDMIRENLHFDFGFIYSHAIKGNAISGPFAYFGDALNVQGHSSFSAAWASVADIYQAKLEEIMNVFTEED